MVGYSFRERGQIGETFYGPSSPDDWNSWIAVLRKFSKDTLAKYNYSGANYGLHSLKWTQSLFVSTSGH